MTQKPTEPGSSFKQVFQWAAAIVAPFGMEAPQRAFVQAGQAWDYSKAKLGAVFNRKLPSDSTLSPDADGVAASKRQMQEGLAATREAVTPYIGAITKSARTNWQRNRENTTNDDEAITRMAKDLMSAFEERGAGKFVPAIEVTTAYEDSVPELRGRLIEKVLSIVRDEIQDRMSKGGEERVRAIGDAGVVAKQLADGSQGQKTFIDLWKREVTSLSKTNPASAKTAISLAIMPGRTPLRAAAEEIQEKLANTPVLTTTTPRP
jgi:hypothetical protein